MPDDVRPSNDSHHGCLDSGAGIEARNQTRPRADRHRRGPSGPPVERDGPAVRKVLEEDPRLEVRIVEDPEFLASPVLADYNVICLHFKNYKPLVREARRVRN